MFLVLFSIGEFQFQTIWLFILVSFLVFFYLVFLQSEDQILPTAKIFDLILISGIFSLISARVVEALLKFGEIGWGQFFKIWQVGQTNLWGAVFGGLAVFLFLSRKFKLPLLQVADIVSLAAIPAMAVISLGLVLQQGVTPGNLFAAIWFLAGSYLFFKASAKIQFPGFYTTLAALIIATSQLFFGIFRFESQLPGVFNLTVSVLVLTTTTFLFYKRNRKVVREILVMIGQKTLEQIKRKLVRQRKTLESELATLKRDDPFLVPSRELWRESGEDAATIEGHERITIVRENLKRGLTQVKRALAAIGLGKYGKCERCGQKIKPARLKVIPSATLCFSCEKEVEKKRVNI